MLSAALTAAVTSSIALERFPKSAVEAFVVAVQDDGALLPNAITALSLGLADAHIDLVDLVAAASVHLLHPSRTLVVDCDRAELEHPALGVSMTLAWMAATASFTHIDMDGRWSDGAEKEGKGATNIGDEGAVDALMSLATAQCEKVLAMMRNCLREGYERKALEQKQQQQR